ncbi:MAG: hypothetical protein J7K77_04710 [Dehalococcoidales bacterium]|nr:hypothetical protein [Dehalococcoidales bacterium]
MTLNERITFVKSIVRPFIIVWGCIIYGFCVMKGVVIPQPLSWLISAVIIEYFGERAIKRFKEK